MGFGCRFPWQNVHATDHTIQRPVAVFACSLLPTDVQAPRERQDVRDASLPLRPREVVGVLLENRSKLGRPLWEILGP